MVFEDFLRTLTPFPRLLEDWMWLIWAFLWCSLVLLLRATLPSSSPFILLFSVSGIFCISPSRSGPFHACLSSSQVSVPSLLSCSSWLPFALPAYAYVLCKCCAWLRRVAFVAERWPFLCLRFVVWLYRRPLGTSVWSCLAMLLLKVLLGYGLHTQTRRHSSRPGSVVFLDFSWFPFGFHGFPTVFNWFSSPWRSYFPSLWQALHCNLFWA